MSPSERKRMALDYAWRLALAMILGAGVYELIGVGFESVFILIPFFCLGLFFHFARQGGQGCFQGDRRRSERTAAVQPRRDPGAADRAEKASTKNHARADEVLSESCRRSRAPVNRSVGSCHHDAILSEGDANDHETQTIPSRCRSLHGLVGWPTQQPSASRVSRSAELPCPHVSTAQGGSRLISAVPTSRR